MKEYVINETEIDSREAKEVSEEELSILNKYKVDNNDFFYGGVYLQFSRNITKTGENAVNVEEYIIDQEKLRYIIQGMVRYDDPDWGGMDFEELQDISDDYETFYSKAIIFTGEYGCGKHTAEKAAVHELKDTIEKQVEAFDKDIEEIFRFYRFDFDDFEEFSKKERKDCLQKIFDELKQMAVSDWAKDSYAVVSFGDITSILKNKKTALFFIRNITELKQQDKVNFYFTCIFEGKTSKLKEKYRKPFLVYELMKPDYKARKLFFSDLKINHRQIYIGYREEDMAEKTEGFTISMLVELRRMFLLYMKGQIITRSQKDNEKSSYKEYVQNVAGKNDVEDQLIISSNIINDYIRMIKEGRYESKSKRVNYIAEYQASVINSANKQQNGREEKNEESKDDYEERIKKEVQSISTFGEMEKEQRNLTPSLTFTYGISEEEQKQKQEKLAKTFAEREAKMEEVLEKQSESGEK